MSLGNDRSAVLGPSFSNLGKVDGLIGMDSSNYTYSRIDMPTCDVIAFKILLVSLPNGSLDTHGALPFHVAALCRTFMAHFFVLTLSGRRRLYACWELGGGCQGRPR